MTIEMAGPWITEHEEKMVMDAMRNGWYGKDKYYYCETLQSEFAQYHDRKHGIMTPNCTTAIHLLLTALGIGPGDEVIVPECTWIATVAPVTYLGATPVFCDIYPEHWCMSAKSVSRYITPRTKAIISVGLYGNMPYMEHLESLAEQHGIFLIEDAAESLGSTYKGIKSGKFGVGSTFSFHRTKTMTTGEGGMLLLDDDDLYERCMFLRDHGRDPERMYWNLEATYKYMPFNLQAALGYAQFQRLDELVKKKQDQFNFYKGELSDIPDLQFNATPVDGVNSYWITGLVFGRSYKIKKEDAINQLEVLGVPVRPFFYPLSSMPAFNQGDYYSTKNVHAYQISSRGINLPGAANMTLEEQKFVCDGIRKILGK